MLIIDVANLKPGRKILFPLFDPSGRKLLAGQTELTGTHTQALQRANLARVFMAETAQQVQELNKNSPQFVNVRELVPGSIAGSDLLTPDNAVAIQQNQEITPNHIQTLLTQGMDYLIQRPEPDSGIVRKMLEQQLADVCTQAESHIKRTEYMRIPPSRDPFKNALADVEYSELLRPGRVHQVRLSLLLQLQPIFTQLEFGKAANWRQLDQIASQLMDLMRTHKQFFTLLAWPTQKRADYLPDHALSVAIQALNLATHLNYSAEHVREVTLAGMLADLGMLALPRMVRTGSDPLFTIDRQLLAQHPIFGLCMMQQIPSMSPIPRLAVYQHHERLDGSGYPVGQNASCISDVARILALADCFSAMTNRRRYQEPLLPALAMEKLLRCAQQDNLFDLHFAQTMQQSLGAYPVGSYVLLSNQELAWVVAANPIPKENPKVVLLNAPNFASTLSQPEMITPGQPPYAELTILGPVEKSAIEEMVLV